MLGGEVAVVGEFSSIRLQKKLQEKLAAEVSSRRQLQTSAAEFSSRG
jgi:hypothetical protein